MMIHKWIAHPLQTVLVKLGFRRLGFLMHDKTLPELPTHIWSHPPFGHRQLNKVLKGLYPKTFNPVEGDNH
jgi:hypothetical protein